MKKIFYLFLLTLVSATAIQAQIENDSVVLYFPLDGNFADSSGNNHATSRVFGNAFTYEDGVMGQSIQFNKNVFVTDEDSLLNTFNDHTFAVWVNLDTIPTEAGEAMTFVHQTDVGPNAGRIHVECRNPNNDFSSLTGNKRVSGGSVVDSTWIHVASVVDVTAGQHYLYVDGEQVASIAKGTENNFGQFVFGSFKDQSKFYARGNMDEMLLTKEVLDATQLKQIMKYGVKVAKDSLVLVTGVTLSTTVDGDSVELGKTLQIDALVDPNDAYDTTLTWSVDYDTVATIDENGVLTAVSAGTVIVTATANDFSGISKNITIKVFKYPVEDITLSVTPNDTISLSGSAIVSAFAVPDTASSKVIIWGVDDENVATVASETDTSATLTPKQIGNVRVYAMASDGSMVVDSIDIVITGIEVTDIALSVAGDTTVMVGDSLQVLASVDPSNAADTTLTWSVDNESIATVDASTGMLTGISV
ncbi:MAG: Ig-like domain-containing protein, partial [Bacteroidales bacterium]|nr:Ig-like domain-containing protein [Bacteroidales bacterium]